MVIYRKTNILKLFQSPKNLHVRPLFAILPAIKQLVMTTLTPQNNTYRAIPIFMGGGINRLYINTLTLFLCESEPDFAGLTILLINHSNHMEITKLELYETPTTEVVELKTENGILTSSNNSKDQYDPTTW